MFPVIFSIGPFTLYTFGVFMFLAFFLALFVIYKRGKELHFDEEQLFDGVFAVLFWMLLGSRLLYVASHFKDFGFEVWQWFNLIGRPGFWYFGGLLGGVVGIARQAKIRKWDMYQFGDVMVTGLALAHIVVALGMFFNGSGYGHPTESFLGMTFPGLYDRRHPVQLYEAGLYIGVFWFLWWAEGAYRTFAWYKGGRSQANSGFITGSFFITQGLVSLGLSLLRPAFISFYGVRLEVVGYAFWLLFGVWVLINRSGLKWAQVKSWFQPVPIPGVTPTIKIRERHHDGKRIKLGQDIFE